MSTTHHASSRPALVVSIHDVSPLTREKTDRILADFADWGVSITSLLIVPEHHSRADVSTDSDFQKWLLDRVDEGHEAVLHGYFHRRERRSAEDLRTGIVTRIYTADEGEFFDIELDEAREKLRRGLEALQFLKQKPAGFIAPAWLLSEAGERACAELGFLYTTRLATVKALQTGVEWRSQSLVWSTRAAWRRVCSLAWNRCLFLRVRRERLLRIGIHPPDWDYAPIRTQLRKLCKAALVTHAPITYENWIRRETAS